MKRSASFSWKGALLVPTLCGMSAFAVLGAQGQLSANAELGQPNLTPTILNSAAYQNGGALFITWDEAASGDGPIGMIVLSPFAKGNGYETFIHYTHGSTLRTFEEIFGVTPLLNDAANEADLSDLFAVFP